MKKLMIAAAIVCAAVVSQAATASWSWKSSTTSTKGVVYDGTADATAYATFSNGGKTPIMFYLFDAAEYSQATAFADLAKGELKTAKAVSSATLNSSSKIGQTDFDHGVFEDGTTHNYTYYAAAIFDDSTFYISDEITKASIGTGAATMQLVFNTSSKSLLDVAEGYKGASVYQTVPEPTSGLLLLLGIGAMALRRRRA